MFITLEGIDGSGKTTQSKKLRDFFIEKGKEVLLTREPGGTIFAEKVRELLLSENGISDPKTEYLLFTAARLDHVNNLIKPALKDNKVVICDRFYDSSLVYQGYLKGLSFEDMDSIYKNCFGNFEPDITFLLDLSPKDAASRITTSRADESNHYDIIKLDSKEKIRSGFLEISRRNQGRIKVIDASTSERDIFANILKYIKI